MLDLTTHSTEMATVGAWYSDICMVVPIKLDPQTKGCLQNHKLSTQVDVNSTNRGDGCNDHCSVDLIKKIRMNAMLCLQRS